MRYQEVRAQAEARRGYGGRAMLGWRRVGRRWGLARGREEKRVWEDLRGAGEVGWGVDVACGGGRL
ncbi:hypothetical protein B1218_38615 [Pseudomonas ogarae]|nr:hypothetical protein B1218_38615 [Pseudomonas ogarae]